LGGAGSEAVRKDQGNLISTEIREAPQRRRMLTFTGLLVCLLAAASLTAAGVIEWVRRSQLESVTMLDTQIADLRGQHQELQKSFAEVEQMEEVIRLDSEEKLSAVPNRFLGYLSEVVPDELMLNRLQVTRTNNLWSVQLAGISRANLDLARTGALQRAFTSLSSNLMSGPFHLAITRSELGKTNPAPAAKSFGTGLLARFAQARPLDQREIKGPHPFIVEGVMR
jgi:Tfp pilus assembly protein PilN